MKTTTRPASFLKVILFLICASHFHVASLAADKQKTKPKVSLAVQVAASEARAQVKCPDAFKSGTALQSAFWDIAYHYDRTKPGWRNQGDWPEQLIEIITHSSPSPEWHTERILAEMKAEQDKIDAKMSADAAEDAKMPWYFPPEEAARYRRGLFIPGLEPAVPAAPGMVDRASGAAKVPVQISTGIDMAREEGGVLKVPVQINGTITLKFVVDSGASEVQIPKDVVLTLIRAETIKESDFLPGKTFVLADGSKVKSDRFMLRSIKVGESTFADVEASVGGLDAQLLLGQSFLSRFKEWTIDNKNAKLILTK